MALARAVGGMEREMAAVWAAASLAPSAKTAPSNALTYHFIGFLRMGCLDSVSSYGTPGVEGRVERNCRPPRAAQASAAAMLNSAPGRRGSDSGHDRGAPLQLLGSASPQGSDDHPVGVNADRRLGAGLVAAVPPDLDGSRPARAG